MTHDTDTGDYVGGESAHLMNNINGGLLLLAVVGIIVVEGARETWRVVRPVAEPALAFLAVAAALVGLYLL